MAKDDRGDGTDQKIRRGVVRTMTNGTLLILALAVLGGWLSTGIYRLELGEKAIILRLGEHNRTVSREGLNWHLPEPLEYDHRVNVSGVRTEIFGTAKAGEDAAKTGGAATDGIFIQTADKNIVSLTFDLQYTIDDPYAFVYSMAHPRETLYEATLASVREVIGGMTVDEVLVRQKARIELDARTVLRETLSEYAKDEGGLPAFAIDKISLQDVQPPNAVRAAFQEVSSAGQDEERSISRAKGDAQEILEQARAEAAELREGSEAYKEAKVLEAKGAAARFIALYTEYARAPVVTRSRLYLETMETVLPGVEKMIVEPDTVGVMPFLQPSTRAVPGPSKSSPPSAPPAVSTSGKEAAQ